MLIMATILHLGKSGLPTKVIWMLSLDVILMLTLGLIVDSCLVVTLTFIFS